MKLRPYSVTVMDNWTPTREFFTLAGAMRHYALHPSATLYRWFCGKWIKMILEREDACSVCGYRHLPTEACDLR